MAQRYDLIIVGFGSAGMTAANFAATLPIKAAVVERDRVGGDCLWTGCVPSKALIASARAAHTLRHADLYGLSPVTGEVDTAPVFARVRRIQQEIAAADDNAEAFEAKGVDVHFGPARLTGPHTVRVGEEAELEARFILLCTGSRPAAPPVDGLAEAGYETSETLWDLERAPRSLVLIGGGPIAVELSQAMARLGVATTVLQRGPRILPRDEPELVDVLTRRLGDEGVEVCTRVDVEAVSTEGSQKVVHGRQGGEPRTWRADAIFVGAGRRPNVEGLGLEELGIAVTKRGVAVDDAYRSAVKSVYAVGDLAGRYLFTHSAGFEASRAIRNMFFPGSSSGAFVVPWCTFTEPELAHAGLTVAEAKAEHGDDHVRVWRQALAHNDRARTESEADGALILVGAKGRLVGAHALAPAAGEVINELALAVQRGLKLTDLSASVHVYPTIGIGVQELAGDAAYESAQRLRRLVRSTA